MVCSSGLLFLEHHPHEQYHLIYFFFMLGQPAGTKGIDTVPHFFSSLYMSPSLLVAVLTPTHVLCSSPDLVIYLRSEGSGSFVAPLHMTPDSCSFQIYSLITR